MNIFEYAMQIEKDGEDYYRQLAQQTVSKGMRTILAMLADHPEMVLTGSSSSKYSFFSLNERK
jgi:hypothetical protein